MDAIGEESDEWAFGEAEPEVEIDGRRFAVDQLPWGQVSSDAHLRDADSKRI